VKNVKCLLYVCARGAINCQAAGLRDRRDSEWLGAPSANCRQSALRSSTTWSQLAGHVSRQDERQLGMHSCTGAIMHTLQETMVSVTERHACTWKDWRARRRLLEEVERQYHPQEGG
jgi:hypothetical protein